jgi:hypothetical protein
VKWDWNVLTILQNLFRSDNNNHPLGRVGMTRFIGLFLSRSSGWLDWKFAHVIPLTLVAGLGHAIHGKFRFRIMGQLMAGVHHRLCWRRWVEKSAWFGFLREYYCNCILCWIWFWILVCKKLAVSISPWNVLFFFIWEKRIKTNYFPTGIRNSWDTVMVADGWLGSHSLQSHIFISVAETAKAVGTFCGGKRRIW